MVFTEEKAKEYIEKYNLSSRIFYLWKHRNKIPDYLENGERLTKDNPLYAYIYSVYKVAEIKPFLISNNEQFAKMVVYPRKQKTWGKSELLLECETIEDYRKELKNFIDLPIGADFRNSYIEFG